MIATPVPRRPYLRSFARILALALVALGWTVSPFNAGAAHADSTATSGLTIPVAEGFSLTMEQASDGGWELFSQRDTPHPNFDLLPNGDGSFQISSPGIGCLYNYPSKSRVYGYECSSAQDQKWYLEPEPEGSYLIRSVLDNKCMTATYENSVVMQDCDGTRKQWMHFSPTSATGTSGPVVADLATLYSLKRCAEGGDLTCSFDNMTAETATVGHEECVTPLYDNTQGTTAATPTKSYAQTTGWSNTLGASISQSFGMDAGIAGIITLKVSTTISANYSHTWTESGTVTDTYPYTVQPGQWGWLTRGQLYKKVTGDWTFTNSALNNSWKGTGTSTIPAKEGTDGMQSVITPHSASQPPTDCLGSGT